MSTTVATARITPEDLERMPDGVNYELVDGELEERHVGSESSWIAGKIFLLLSNWCDEQNLGLVWPPDQGYRCFEDDPNRVRKPDVSFIKSGRLPGNQPSQSFETIPPDLAVEVLSPNDEAYKVDRKINEYLAAGISLIWVVNPEERMVTVYRADGSVERILEGGEIRADDVIPGFRCSTSEFFPQPLESAE